MGITNKVIEAQIAAGQGFESTSRKFSERLSKYDESASDHEQMVKDLNAGKISAYDAEGNCLFCARGDYHWLFSLETVGFGNKKKCKGSQVENHLCVDDQRARGIIALKEALDMQTQAYAQAAAASATETQNDGPEQRSSDSDSEPEVDNSTTT